jgi:hypothetical protein
MMVLAVLPAGGGHGWLAPSMVSFPGIMLIPLTGILVAIPVAANEVTQRRRTKAARVLMWVVIILDVVAVAFTVVQARDLLRHGSDIFICIVLGIPWVAMWGFWHVIVMRIAVERM